MYTAPTTHYTLSLHDALPISALDHPVSHGSDAVIGQTHTDVVEQALHDPHGRDVIRNRTLEGRALLARHDPGVALALAHPLDEPGGLDGAVLGIQELELQGGGAGVDDEDAVLGGGCGGVGHVGGLLLIRSLRRPSSVRRLGPTRPGPGWR